MLTKAFQYAIALTGGIATGKSTVASILKDEGFTVIDADMIAHEVLDEEYRFIAKLFGNNIVKNAKVDRKKLGNIVFSDVQKRKVLEAYVHPKIYDKILKISQELDRQKKVYIVDIPLFFENERYAIKRSIVVYATKQQQLNRLMHRNGLSKEEALLRIDSQMDIEKKRDKASYVIDNSGNIEDLYAEVIRIKEKILGEDI